MSYLCVNYNLICKFSLKGLKALHQDNQEYLREHRWPPVWYLKDYDYYQRCLNELNKELKLKSSRRESPSDDEGCLCFTGGKCFHFYGTMYMLHIPAHLTSQTQYSSRRISSGFSFSQHNSSLIASARGYILYVSWFVLVARCLVMVFLSFLISLLIYNDNSIIVILMCDIWSKYSLAGC